MIFFTSIAMLLLANIVKAVPLNSAYIISFQQDMEQVTQPLYLLVVKIILIYLIGRLAKPAMQQIIV